MDRIVKEGWSSPVPWMLLFMLTGYASSLFLVSSFQVKDVVLGFVSLVAAAVLVSRGRTSEAWLIWLFPILLGLALSIWFGINQKVPTELSDQLTKSIQHLMLFLWTGALFCVVIGYW